MTLTSVAIRPAVNGYILAATFSSSVASTAPFITPTPTEILFTDLTSIGAFLTAQQFVPLPAVAAPSA